MHTIVLQHSIKYRLGSILALALGALACQSQPAANGNANANMANTNTTPSSANANAGPASDGGALISTHEPDKYSATLVVTAETSGGQGAAAIPPVSADVARNGADQRISFKLPGSEQIIYLDKGDKHYVISPSRKQYAELTPEAVGFQIGRLMTPGQIVSYLSKQKGYTRVGDDQLNGRTADKYSYAATSKTNSQAGDVNSQTYVYVDKETGLPLRAELFSQTTGSVQGYSNARVVVEMRNIQTNVDPSTFEIPQGMNKVPPEQIRQQVDALMAAVTAVAQGILSNMSNSGSETSTTTTTNTNATPASPAGSPSPAAKTPR
jgi:outer membrane lipoprotein-sorting protein